MTLANRLRALMRWRGIKSQNQLARISGVPQSSVHRILARGDDYSPSRLTVTRLAKALNTSVTWLTDGIEAPSHTQAPIHTLRDTAPASGIYSPPGAFTDAYSTELHSLMQRLPAASRKKIVALVRLIVEAQQASP